MNKNIQELAEKLRIPFKEGGHLMQAMVHRSYLNEHPDFPLEHNERLEFLGDAALSIVVSNFLYEKLPNDPEGKLSLEEIGIPHCLQSAVAAVGCLHVASHAGVNVIGHDLGAAL